MANAAGGYTGTSGAEHGQPVVLSSCITVADADGRPLFVIGPDGIDCPHPERLTPGGHALWKKLRDG